MNWRHVYSAVVTIALVPSFAFGQEQIAGASAHRDPATGRVYSYSFAVSTKTASPSNKGRAAVIDPVAIADSFIAANKDTLGIKDPATELIKLPVDRDELGNRQKYLQQFMYKGSPIPVYAGELSVHTNKGGQITYVKTKIVDDLPVNISAKVSLAKAKAAALKLAQREAGGISIKVSKAKLVVLPLGIVLNTPESNTRLAYEVEVLDSQPKHPDQEGDRFSNTYFIDGVSGQKLFEVSGHRGINREVYDCASGPNANQCQIDMPDPVYTTFKHGASEGLAPRGPFPNPNFPLFYGSTEVDMLSDLLLPIHNYYSATFDINGANGFGGLAVWPTVLPKTITRGVAHNDGYAGYECTGGAVFSFSTGTIFFCRNMVVPDVVAHEYTHGVVHHSFHDGSGYPIGDIYSGQTASLDEGYADFMGEAFQNSYTGSTNWISGSESGVTFRNLADPHATLRSGDGLPYPDRFYDSTFYCGDADSGGAHRNMTVPAHAFYLMAQGGEHNGCDIAGQGIDVAQKILFRGWRSYFSQNVTFNEAYTDLIQACSDLYSPTVCVEVTKALQSVEMDQVGACPIPLIPEVAPACAVKHSGISAASYRHAVATSVYAPNEQVWVSGLNGVAGKSINIYMQPHTANLATWGAISGTPLASTVVNWNLKFRTFVTSTSLPGQYDIIIDGNSDGFYQPWADSVIPIEVKVPVNGDGICYKGQSYQTSEDCGNQAGDCQCPANYSCIDAMYSRTNPAYVCYPNLVSGPS